MANVVRLSLAVIALTVAQPAFAQSRVVEGVAVAAHALDAVSSLPCLNGVRCVETNTLYAGKPVAVLAGTKAAVAVAQVLMTRRIAKSGHPRIALVLNVAVSSLVTSVAVNNFRMVRR